MKVLIADKLEQEAVTALREIPGVEVVVDGMVVTSAVCSVGEVTLADNSGATIARLVPPPLGIRRRIGRRLGWDPVLVSEQTSVADPVTGRGVNALALAWEHTVREWAG